MDKIKLKLCGNYNKKVITYRFINPLRINNPGVSLVIALEMSVGMSSNQAFKSAMDSVIENVSLGVSLSDVFKNKFISHDGREWLKLAKNREKLMI